MSFTLKSVQNKNTKVTLWSESDNSQLNDNANKFTILIGRNGTGKSRLLSMICKMFIKIEQTGKGEVSPTLNDQIIQNNDYNIAYCTNNREVEISFNDYRLQGLKWLSYSSLTESSVPQNLTYPEKVIATTVSPFDKFPTPKRSIKNSNQLLTQLKDPVYRYLGMKNYAGMVSSSGQISRVIESLVIASKKNTNSLNKISQIFDFLGYRARLVVKYRIRSYNRIFEEIGRLINDAESLKNFTSDKNNIYGSSYYNRNNTDESIDFYEQYFESLSRIKNYISVSHKNIEIDLDLKTGQFSLGSIELFNSITFARSLGIVRLEDVVLFKSSDNLYDRYSISDASSGEQSLVLTFLGIAAEIENDSLIVIDEPEISLHPEWQEKFIPLLTTIFAEFRGCHFILATHSPLILAQAGELNGYVVTMDDLSIEPLADYSKKSADYQLATAFLTPGFQNEYLARQALAALRLVNLRQFESSELRDKVEVLRKARPHINNDDPVAHLTDAVFQALQYNQ